jgi:hypothetical protein
MEIEPFPDTADEFYLLRDDRTNRAGVGRMYTSRSVSVTADPDLLRTEAGQTLFLGSCNLLSRWCRRVSIHVEDCPGALGPGMLAASLIDTAVSQMRDADPFGVFAQSGDDPNSSDLRLHVGVQCDDNRIPTTLISASGWNALVGRPGSVPPAHFGNGTGRIGALFAAGLGAAQVFRDALSIKQATPRAILFDALRMRFVREPKHDFPGPNSADLGELLMIGAGAVAGAAAFCLKMQDSKASVTIVDGDIAKVENFNRSPILGRRQYGLSKAETVAGFFEGSKIRSAAVSSWFDEMELTEPDVLARYDVWLPLANERNVRWLVQNLVPPLMIQASTNGSWGFNFGRHIPGFGDCLADRFAGQAGDEAMRCSEGSVIDLAVGHVDAALPFLSFLAGASIASELERLNMPRYPYCSNFVAFDLSGEEPGSQSFDRRARQQCVCRSQQSLFQRYRSTTKYAHLSANGWKA